MQNTSLKAVTASLAAGRKALQLARIQRWGAAPGLQHRSAVHMALCCDSLEGGCGTQRAGGKPGVTMAGEWAHPRILIPATFSPLLVQACWSLGSALLSLAAKPGLSPRALPWGELPCKAPLTQAVHVRTKQSGLPRL